MMNNIEIFPISKHPDEIYVHPTSIVDSTAKISPGVRIGAYSVIGKNVRIEKNTEIFPHVIIDGNTSIGEDCKIFYGAVIGSKSQDLKAEDKPSFVIIGNKNIIREYVTINQPSKSENHTVIGENNFIMAYSHIAHDCTLGNNNILANSVNIGGHCKIENNCVIGGLTGVHQFVRVGSYSMTGGLTRITQDIPPFFTTVGNPAMVEGVNITGLKRNNFTRETIKALKEAYKIIYCSGLTLNESLSRIDEFDKNEEIEYLVEFYRTRSKRGISGL